MPELVLYQDYSREDVHGIFSRGAQFHGGAGSWGLAGIIRIPDRPGDFVFMVSYGTNQSGHSFNEPVTDDGVIEWQSQPNQKLNYPQIREIVSHDDLVNSIYLFLRTRPGRKYTYLGKLKYLSHDTQRESPVWFKWQILDWDIKPETLDQMGLVLSAPTGQPVSKSGITVHAPPPGQERGETTQQFSGHRTSHTPELDANNKSLGTAGEKLVVQHEKENLVEVDRHDLAGMVRHVAVDEGDGAGYDVRSYTADGIVKHIEVKTTRGGINSSFYITRHEVNFSKGQPDNFYLYRLFDFNTNSASMYVLQGDISKSLALDPINYRAAIRPPYDTQTEGVG